MDEFGSYDAIYKGSDGHGVILRNVSDAGMHNLENKFLSKGLIEGTDYWLRDYTPPQEAAEEASEPETVWRSLNKNEFMEDVASLNFMKEQGEASSKYDLLKWWDLEEGLNG